MRASWFSEGLASVVVFLVALPLCMGIAIASGVPPAMGLISGIIGGIVVGSLAGSPLQVSGPAAGLAVIVYEIIQSHGLVAFGPIVLVAGLLQAVAGKLRIGQWFRAVSPAVIYAMLAGIGVLIFGSQVHVMMDLAPPGSGLDNLLGIPGAILTALQTGEGTTYHVAAGVGLLTIAVMIVWNGIRERLPKPLSVLPAPLLAVGAAVTVAVVFQLPITYVSLPDSVGGLLSLPTLEGLASLLNPAVLGSALALALIASAQALLCAVAVDRLHDGDRSDLDKELFAQGIGNAVSGLVGGLPVTGVIVRSTANVESGGKTRAVAILHGIWLVAAIVAVPFLLERVPVSALAAILVYIGFKLVDMKVPKKLAARSKGEVAIYWVTVAAIVSTNLLEGLMIGVVLSLLRLAWQVSHLTVRVEECDVPQGRLDVHLEGSGTFVGLPILTRELNALPAGREVHIHVERADYIDHACLEALSEWRGQYELAGGIVVLEWEAVQARSTHRARREAAE